MDFNEAIKATAMDFVEQAHNARQPEGTVNQTETVEETITEPTDLLQESRDQRRAYKPRGSRGAMPRMKLDLSAINDNLMYAYKKAKDDSDYYKNIGNRQYAEMVRQQYMEDWYLPAVDALIKMNGMGAIQSNKELLSKLDALTLLDGTEGNGYTETFIASMYAPEGQVEASDAQVQDAVREITYLCESDQIRSAVGKANGIKKRIDAGENVATDEDYEIIQRVALYGV